MISKLFEARNKLTDIDALKKYLDKSELSHDDYLNLMRGAFDKNREKFVKIIAILKTYDKNILQSKLEENPLFLDICRIGTADDVNGLLELESLKVLDRQGESMYFALQNDQKKYDKNESLEIVKILYNADPKLATSLQHSKPVIAEAIERQKFEIVSFLLEKDVDVFYESHEKDNLLHLLMRNFIKKYDKMIENIRIVLVERGVDEKKCNSSNKKPYQLCPPDVGKRLNEDHRQHMSAKTNKGDENIRYENKFREGELSRVRNTTEYREKIEKSTALSFENKNELEKEADRIFERITKEKQKEMPERDKEKMKEKDKLREKEKKEKINKRVFSPDELKHFLNEEINYFVEQIEHENELQKAYLNEIVDKITKEIKSKFKAELKIFGSFATGLCLTLSDIDMVIIPEENEETSPLKLMEDISNFLLTLTEDVASIKFIKTASIPIIKIECTEKYGKKTIDITFKDENHNGLSSLTLIKNYLAIYPQLRPLAFVLKNFMYSINLSSPYSGGLSSYGLILMIVAFLQNQNREKKSRGFDCQKSPSTGEILIGFLEFYGFKYNYISKKICILNPEPAKEEMDLTELNKYQEYQIYMDAIDMDMTYSNRDRYIMEDWQPRAKLVIIDPLNMSNNIGRATHKIREIKTAFEMAYVSIHTNKNCKNKRNCESYQRISNLNLKDTKCENYQRPCCIIKRMLNSTKSLIVL